MPREGHDAVRGFVPVMLTDISIHVPREGHDAEPDDEDEAEWQFQSTCPARGTTRLLMQFVMAFGISIHVPREGHDLVNTFKCTVLLISIHVPREGHDQSRGIISAQSTQISIHVPREGHDS